jgi:hypothetical protein
MAELVPYGLLSVKAINLGQTGVVGGNQIYLNPQSISFFAGNLSISGTLTANAVVAANSGIADLRYAIGIPTPNADTRPINISNSSFTNNIGLNLTPATLGTDGFQLLDRYIDVYMYDTPPAPVLSGTTSASTFIGVSWTNPSVIKSAFTNTTLPCLLDVKVQIVKSSENGGLTWNGASLQTISTGTTGTRGAYFYTSGSGSGLTGDVYNSYSSILASTSYDVRVYITNYSTRTLKYLTILGLSTTTTGKPGIVTSVTTSSPTTSSLNTSWTAPADNDDITAGNNTLPIISTYRVVYTPTSTVRYGGLFSTADTISNTTTTSYPTPSSTSITTSSLLPGTGYSVYVSAKNEVNALYGPTGAGSGTTIVPTKPTSLVVSDCSSLTGVATISGYALDGSTVITPIINLNASPTIKTTTSGNILLNNTAGSSASALATLTGNAGGSSTSVSINGFPTMASIVAQTTNRATINITAETDAYSGSSTNFWKTATVNVQAASPATNYPASISSYSMNVQYSSTQGASSVSTTPVVFYTDLVSSVPVITNAGIKSETANGYQYVSGVPSYTTAATFMTQFNISNIANKFLRSDRTHATVQIISGTTSISNPVTITKTTIGASHKYYNTTGNDTTSVSLMNTSGLQLSESPGGVQFNDYTITLGATGNNKYAELMYLTVAGYNLLGSGSSSGTPGYVSNAASPVTNPLRIDTVSIASLPSSKVRSGGGVYPNINTGVTGAGDVYDHTVSLIASGYTEELQYINGNHRTPANGGYSNYSTFYFPAGASSLPNYSSITADTNIRYATFKFTGIGIGITTGQTRDKIRIILNGMSGLTVNMQTPNTQNHIFQVAIVDTPSTSTNTWLDATNVILPVGLLTGTNGTPCLNQGTSTNTQRDCTILSGTTENAVIYVRVGIRNNINATIQSVTVTAVTTFT